MKTQHENPQFGHKQAEIPGKKTNTKGQEE
jgi:hypothetical protein